MPEQAIDEIRSLAGRENAIGGDITISSDKMLGTGGYGAVFPGYFSKTFK